MIELVRDTIDKKDINRLIKWLKTYPRLTKGPLTVDFENKWSNMLGAKYSTFVNSGSSAILMMLQALLEAKRVSRGAKVVVPALSWATDFSSVVQLGFEPVICDCNLDNLSVDLKQLEDIFQKEKPSVLLLVSVLGLVPDMDSILALCNKYNVILLEDACESLGSRYGNKQLGTFGVMSIFSSYFGHHISTIEGGIVSTNDPELDMILKAIRNHGWARDLTEEQKIKLQNEFQIDHFSALYTFYYLGFNFRATDLQAYLGIDQIDKLPNIIEKRNMNYRLYKKLIKTEWKPNDLECAYVSNFAYPVITKEKEKLVQKLQSENIQCRPLICGSMTNQPFFTKNFVNRFDTPNAKYVDEFGLYIPNHPTLKKKEIQYVSNVINNGLGSK
jgi:CDP-6-deoxy-D-xylo-4-hexulose-3-dehydrase